MNKQKHERSLNDLRLQFEEGYRWLARNENDWLLTFKDESPVLNAEPIVQAPDNLRNLLKLHYLEKKDMFIATIPVYTNKDAITGVQKQLEELLGSKVVAINGEFEYIKELHNLSS